MEAVDEEVREMKVLWIVNCMLPEFSAALGRAAGNTGGWLPSLVAAIRNFVPNMELHILCECWTDAEAIVDGVHYYAFSKINRPWLGNARRRADFGRKLKALIRQISPDLIHLHGTENGYADFDDDVWGNYPRVISLQGIITAIAPHYMGNLTSGQLRPYRNWLRYIVTRRMQTDVADNWRNLVGPREAMALAKLKHIIGRTDWDRAWSCALAPNATYHRVGEILRPEFYGDHDKSDVMPHRIFASAAFKYPLKGGHVLLQAVSYLKHDFPDIKVVVADADRKLYPRSLLDRLRMTEYHNFLNAEISLLGLDENVEVLSSLNAVSIADQIKKAEVFCLPSLIENSPNSLAEAQLIGTPCVATDVGGISSMLENEKTGLLVPSGDAACLAYAIRRLFEDKELAMRLAHNAKRVALRRHDAQSIVAELVSCYNQCAL